MVGGAVAEKLRMMECSGNNGLGWREYVSQSQFPILENPQNSHEKRTSQRKKKLLPRKQTPEQQRLSASLRALVQSFSRSRRTGSRLMAAHFDLGVPTHGLKRPADSDPDGDQPLTKKFNRLHIGIDLSIYYTWLVLTSRLLG